ncbi:MAG: N-acetylneuraminate synthase family protein [Gaiellaceae bacterium]
MSAFAIGGRAIGPGEPVFVVAEAADAHLGSLDTAKEMALQAKLAGADAVKFQHHLPDEEMLRDVPMSDNFEEPLYDFLVRHALTLDQHAELLGYCREIGIRYLCTPFSHAAARELDSIGVDSFKIGSGELTDIPSLVKIAGLGHPMLVSTGMATLEEIDETVAALRETSVPLALMNCVSEYPPVYEDMNLRTIRVLQERYPDLPVGHSDHTPDLYTSFAAVTLGAHAIEKHVILDKRQPGPDQSVSVDMPELHQLVGGIRKIEAALGSEKAVHEREAEIRAWAHRSVVSLQAIPAGATIAEEMVWTKRPGTGIPSKQLSEVIGRVAARDIEANALLSWDDLA